MLEPNALKSSFEGGNEEVNKQGEKREQELTI
jgi:hypothetical protein